MTRDDLTRRLKAKGVSPAQLCRNLNINRSTYTRWRRVPDYAIAYLVALELSDEGLAGKLCRMKFHHRIAVTQEESKRAD